MPSALDLLLSQLRSDIENTEAPVRSQLVLSYESAVYQLEQDLFRVTWLIEDARSRGVDISPAWLYQQDRYIQLIEKAEQQFARFAREGEHIVTSGQRQSARVGTSHASTMLEAGGVRTSFGTEINTVAVDRLHQLMYTNGSPVKDVLDTYGPGVTEVIRDQMGQGVIQGLSPREVVRGIIGQLASGTNRARLSTLTRTEMMRSYRLAQNENYKQFANAIQEYRWLAALSSRTCLACLAMHNQRFSEPQSKFHPNCRCIMSPIGKYTPERYRDNTTGEEWLAQQPENVQRAMMPSEAAYDAYKNGEIGLNDFVGERHDPTWGTTVYQKSGRQVLGEIGGGGVGSASTVIEPVRAPAKMFDSVSQLDDDGISYLKEEIREWAGDDLTWVNALPEDQRRAVYMYSGAGGSHSRHINPSLRTGDFSNVPEITKTEVDLIDHAIQHYQTPTDVVVYRGIEGGIIPNDLRAGDYWGDKAFISTSFNQYVSGRYSSGVDSMRITVPQGTNAIVYDNFLQHPDFLLPSGRDKSRQQELLLPRGGSFRVTNVDWQSDEDGGGRILDVEYIQRDE